MTADEQHHLKPYQFQPGQSGNPSGRPKSETLDSVLRGLVDKQELARKLIAIASKEGRDQQRAIEYIYNRLAGAPRQTVRIDSDEADAGLALMRELWSRLVPAEQPAIETEHWVLDNPIAKDAGT